MHWNYDIEKVVFITPHLSTGGLPQYLAKKVEEFVDILTCDVYVIEYSDITGGQFVVQRNKIQSVLINPLITLGENKSDLIKCLEYIKPDYIHIEEFCETFISYDINRWLFRNDRTYKIFETSHGSDLKQKTFLPDGFIFVSPSQLDQYRDLGVPMSLLEYPIEYHERPDRIEVLNKLNLDPNKKHILNIGLFTPGKNQAEIFEYAKSLPDHQFHFVGNQAGNFADYWRPLMQNKPDNCIVWGERADVELFYSAMDLFLFTSKLELNPLVLREAIGWRIPILMYNLPIYQNSYDKFNNIGYLTNNKDINLNLIKGEKNDISKEIVVITAYPDTPTKEELLVELINNIKSFGYDIMISSHYNVTEYIQQMVNYNVLDLTDNLLYRKDYKEYGLVNYLYNTNQNRIIKKTSIFNHAYAVWLLWKNAVNELKTSQYNKIHILDYDCIISDKRYLDNHSNLLSLNDLVIYESNDVFNKNRFTTNLFSFNLNEETINLFNYYTNKKDFFVNEFNTTLLEDMFFCLINKLKIKHISFPEPQVHRFNSRINVVCGDCDPLDELSTPYFRMNIYNYSDNKDILLLSNSSTLLMVDNVMYSNTVNENLYLIDKASTHTISYIENGERVNKVVDMSEHGQFNTIEVHNTSILIDDNKPKIRVVHMVTEPDTNIREIESAKSIKSFTDSFDNIEYCQVINEIYKLLPPAENCANPDWIAMEPGHQKLSPGHYGCYLAHRKGVSLPDNLNYDIVVIFEGDALITANFDELYINLLRWSKIADEENMNLVGFGNINFDYSSNERDDLYLNVNTFIPAHAYFVTKRSVPIVVNAYNTTKWQVADLWMTNISGLRKAITKKVYSQQIAGYSLLDKKIKNKSNDLSEIYNS